MPKQRGFQHVLARARQYKAWLDDGTHRSLSSIARAEGVTSGRIGDILDLLTLSPAILAAIDVPADRLARGTTHEELRRIGRLGDHDVQENEVRRRWPGLLGAVAAK